MKKSEWGVCALWLCFVVAAKYLKFGLFVGEQSIHFVAFSAVLPVIGYFFKGRSAGALILGGWFLSHWGHGMPITVGIPTYLAMLSYRASARGGAAHWAMHGFFPLAMMALFILSPAGAGAWEYSLYWLIPVGLSLFGGGVVSRALQSTFVAHAAGSVLFAYLTPISSAAWRALIPVVAVERLFLMGVALGVIGVVSLVLRVWADKRFTAQGVPYRQ